MGTQTKISRSSPKVAYRNPSNLEAVIEKVCYTLIVQGRITIWLPDEVSDQILFWAMETVETAYATSNLESLTVAAIVAHALAVAQILLMVLVGVDTDHILAAFHRWFPTLRVEELPENLEEMMDVLLANFRNKASR